MYFIKAPPGLVTRHLWVGGVHGMTVRQLTELFKPYGNPEVVLPEHTLAGPALPPPPSQQPQPQEQAKLEQPQPAPPSPGQQPPHHGPQQDQQQHRQQHQQPLGCFHAFLTFRSEADATAAVAAVPRDAPWASAGGRKLVLNYADVRRDKRPVPRPIATSTDGLGVPGLLLLLEFITPEQEAQLLAAVDAAAAAAAAEAMAAKAEVVEAAAAATEAEAEGTVTEAEAGRCGVGGDEAGPASTSGRGSGGAGSAGGERSGCGGGGEGSSGWEAMARRRVQHYGFKFDYTTRNVDPRRPLGPLPVWAATLAERIGALPQVSQPLDQLTVNEYEPGVGLAPHVDTHSAFTGPIISLSLGSQTVMDMRRGEVARPLLLPPRSLLIMAGESRYAWQHYIPHRLSDCVDGQLMPRGRRVSLTFRQVRGFACDCAYPESCDSQQNVLPPTRISQLQPQQHAPGGAGGQLEQQDPQQQLQQQQQQLEQQDPQQQQQVTTSGATTGGGVKWGGAAEDGGGAEVGSNGGAGGGGGGERDEEARLAAMEAEYVHKVYDAIAPHFSSTRFAIWPRVRGFIESLPPGGLVADVGCGNGKYFAVRRDLAVLGSDISAGLVAVAAQRLHPAGLPAAAAGVPRAADALVADALRLPYRAACADGALCIAVLHHLSSGPRRVRLLRQLLRVLRPGGRAIVTVWATEQEDPAKTLAKWTRIPAPASAPAAASVAIDGSGGSGGGGREMPADAATVAIGDSNLAQDTAGSSHAVASANASSGGGAGGSNGAAASSGAASSGGGAGAVGACDVGGGGTCGGGGGSGGDYFVPWHLPFHRTEAAKAAKEAKEAGADAGGGAPKINSAKGAVVFQRYYHLFTQQELAALVEQALAAGPAEDVAIGGGKDEDKDEEREVGVEGGGACGGGGEARGPCGVLEEVFYDRSNWCVVFRRDR